MLCRLCENSSDLCESHILPKFVFRWLRKSSLTGVRDSETPNLRVQDGWKRDFLCVACEALLNKYETPFAKHLFWPFHKRAASDPLKAPDYRDWCLPFCVSVSWRVLRMAQEDGILPSLTQTQEAGVQSALDTWRDTLLNKRPHPGVHIQQLLPFGMVKEAPSEVVSPYQNRYFLRTMQIDVLVDDDSVVVFSKLGRLAILGFVTPPSRDWRTWDIHVKKGALPVKAHKVPHFMFEYLKAAADDYGAIHERMSDDQQAIARSGVQKSIDDEHESYLAFKADVRISGLSTLR